MQWMRKDNLLKRVDTIQMKADFLWETMKARGNGPYFSSAEKKKELLTYHAKIFHRNEGEFKDLSDEEKLRDFCHQ